jgi:thioredoxin reductase
VVELHGVDQLEAITLINNLTGQQQTVPTCWLFLCLGGIPNTNWAAEAGLVRDEQCYLVTGPDLREHHGFAMNCLSIGNPTTWKQGVRGCSRQAMCATVP